MNIHSLKRIRPLYPILARARWVFGRCFMRSAHGIHGVRPNRVFFSSFIGQSYSDSPARISEALHALRPDAEIVWQLQHPEQAPDYVRVVAPHTFAALKAISTARCVVDNFNRPKYMLKFRDQRYVQTWHGDRGIKKSLYDMEDGQSFPDGDQMDLAVSGSDFGTRTFRTAFRYTGEVMQLGMPRNDPLLSPDPKAIAEIRRRLGVSEGVRLLLYAPTWRNETAGERQRAGFDLSRALDTLQASTGAPWICMVRAHSMNRGLSFDQDDRVMDVTAWPEVAELMLCADMLISDYSSIPGDYILLDRPLILFLPDIEQYLSRDRHLYFDLRSSPYPTAESEEALMQKLTDIDALIPSCAAVRDFYGTTETGRSAEAVARWIAGVLG